MSHSSHPYPAEPTRVIHLSGTERDIGAQHAEQVGPVLRQGMPLFYYGFWNRMLRNAPEGLAERALFGLAKGFIQGVLTPRLTASLPEEAKERVRGMADAAGAPYEEMLVAVLLPDLMPLLQSYLTVIRPSTFIEAAPAPRFGCSSFLSSGSRFLYGRNLDFPGVAYWDRYPVIQVTAKPGRLRHVGFTSAGVPINGITGINEARISVALHQHYCRRTSLKGVLPFFIAERILEEARSLEDARRILDESRVATAWAFVVTDGNRRSGFVYETHPGARGHTALSLVGREAGYLSHTNFFQTRECRPAEYATTARMNWDNHSRKNRLDALLAESRGDLTPERAVAIASDAVDPYWGEEKYVNRTVSQVYNIQSVVFDPEAMLAWVAEGDAPIHLRRYRKWDLGKIFDGKSGDTGETVEGYRFRDDTVREAKESYILSFIAAFDGRFDEALGEVSRTLDKSFCAEGALVTAVLLLKRFETERAIEWLRRALGWVEERKAAKGLPVFPPEYFETNLFLARALDLAGRRAEAQAEYRRVAAHPDLEDSHVRAIARAEGPYTRAKLGRILMPYSTYIPFE